MGDLKENTQYKDLRGAIAPMIKTAQEIGKSLPRRTSKKSVDVSGYKDFANSLGQYNESTAGSTPTSVSNLGTVTTPYMGNTKFENASNGGHPGIDIANKIGTPIQAFEGGKVTEVVTGKKQGDPAFGNYVKILDDNNREWRYSHLSGDWVPTVGSEISQGQVIGQMSNTGQTYSLHGGTGSHLDLRIKDLYNNTYLNPSSLIKS